MTFRSGASGVAIVSLLSLLAGGPAPAPSWFVDGGAPGALFGYCVAPAGDVNGDGYDDVAVFAYGVGQQGICRVYHGSATGLSTTPAWTVTGAAGSLFGYSISGAGDVNGDGYDDVIVGAYQVSSAWVYLGSASGLSLEPAWSKEGMGSAFGRSVAAAGDVNGDGYDDVVVGQPSYDHGENNEGRALVYHGSASGLSDTPDWTDEIDVANAGFGSCVASAGDVNNDGYADVVVGAGAYGAIDLYFGSPSGLAPAPTSTVFGFTGGIGFAASVASAGDVNGDGYGDIIVGAVYYDHELVDEGCAFVYHGSPTGISQFYSWIAEGNQSHSFYGSSVASAGDVNDDGYDDVVIGAANESAAAIDDGRVVVHFGSPTGLSLVPDWSIEGGQSMAHLGICVAPAGDVNGDGADDLIAGAFTYEHAFSNEGRALAFHGTPAVTLPCDADFDDDGLVNGGDLGSLLGAWGPCPGCATDLDGDGVVNGSDLGTLLGAWGDCP